MVIFLPLCPRLCNQDILFLKHELFNLDCSSCASLNARDNTPPTHLCPLTCCRACLRVQYQSSGNRKAPAPRLGFPPGQQQGQEAAKETQSTHGPSIEIQILSSVKERSKDALRKLKRPVKRHSASFCLSLERYTPGHMNYP